MLTQSDEPPTLEVVGEVKEHLTKKVLHTFRELILVYEYEDWLAQDAASSQALFESFKASYAKLKETEATDPDYARTLTNEDLKGLRKVLGNDQIRKALEADNIDTSLIYEKRPDKEAVWREYVDPIMARKTERIERAARSDVRDELKRSLSEELRNERARFERFWAEMEEEQRAKDMSFLAKVIKYVVALVRSPWGG